MVVEPLRGGRPVQAFYSTDVAQSAEQVLTGYAVRWSIEEAFQGSKSHLGFEEPQGWNRQAVRRTAPLAMLLYSLTVLGFAREGHALYKPPQRPWYRHKVRPSFADMLATLRYACLRAAISASPTKKQERQSLLLLLPDTLRAVAACPAQKTAKLELGTRRAFMNGSPGRQSSLWRYSSIQECSAERLAEAVLLAQHAEGAVRTMPTLLDWISTRQRD